MVIHYVLIRQSGDDSLQCRSIWEKFTKHIIEGVMRIDAESAVAFFRDGQGPLGPREAAYFADAT